MEQVENSQDREKGVSKNDLLGLSKRQKVETEVLVERKGQKRTGKWGQGTLNPLKANSLGVFGGGG